MINASDVIRIKGEVEVALYHPEYQRQIDETLFKGRSPQNNWLGHNGNEFGHQIHENSIVDGKKMMAALLSYSPNFIWNYGVNFTAATHLSAFNEHDETTLNQYLIRPEAIQLFQSAPVKAFAYWPRGDATLSGRVCDDGDTYCRYLFDIPANHVPAEAGPFVEPAGHHDDGWMNMSINEITLGSPWYRAAYHGEDIVDVGMGFIEMGFFTGWHHPTSIDFAALSIADGTDYQVECEFWPNNLTLEDHRHQLNLSPSADTIKSGVVIYNALKDDLSGGLPAIPHMATKTLSPAIVKTAAYKLAIIWKLTIT
jgi:hypothetical protein